MDAVSPGFLVSFARCFTPLKRRAKFITASGLIKNLLDHIHDLVTSRCRSLTVSRYEKNISTVQNFLGLAAVRLHHGWSA